MTWQCIPYFDITVYINIYIVFAYVLYWQGNIPLGERPDRIQIFAETVDDENKIVYCTDAIPVMPDSGGKVFIQVNTSTPTCTPDGCSLEPHRRYRAIIAAKNQAGETNSTGKICFCKPVLGGVGVVHDKVKVQKHHHTNTHTVCLHQPNWILLLMN